MSEYAGHELNKLNKDELIERVLNQAEQITHHRKQIEDWDAKCRGQQEEIGALKQAVADADGQRGHALRECENARQQRDNLAGFIESMRYDQPVNHEQQTYLDRFLGENTINGAVYHTSDGELDIPNFLRRQSR